MAPKAATGETKGDASKRRKVSAASAAGEQAEGHASTSQAEKMLDFINYAWTPYHAVEEASRMLASAGFQHLSEKTSWDIKAGGKYYFTRNLSTIVAFAVGKQYKPGNGFYMVGAHTDSPCLKLKPVTKSTKSGYTMVNVETYGGGLWYTWFDRDLGLAGRVLVREPGSEGEGKQPAVGSGLSHRLVKIDRPIMRIPMLAIHLQGDIHTTGFKPNLQTNFAPILATNVKAQLEKCASDTAKPKAADTAQGSSSAGASSPSSKHHPMLLELLSKQLGVPAEDIVDFELHVCDVQPGVIGGAAEEFVYVGRLDNLAMSYCSLAALVDSCRSDSALDDESGIRSVALFDHEEVGSESAQGAGGPVMRDTITRVATILAGGEEGAVMRTLTNSFLVSADMAHALHPNYADKHDPDHQPHFHEGLVLKHNANQRYATNSISASLFREVGRRRGISCQEFAVRNDSRCGSTIGPILASNLGCRTLDVGVPQLSMHSIREMCGTDDISISYNHFKAFFEDFSKLDATFDPDQLPPPNLRGTVDDTPCCGQH